jgi:hypothetical protein
MDTVSPPVLPGSSQPLSSTMNLHGNSGSGICTGESQFYSTYKISVPGQSQPHAESHSRSKRIIEQFNIHIPASRPRTTISSPTPRQTFRLLQCFSAYPPGDDTGYGATLVIGLLLNQVQAIVVSLIRSIIELRCAVFPASKSGAFSAAI